MDMFHGFNKYFASKDEINGEEGYYDYNLFRKFHPKVITSYNKKAFFARDFDETDYFLS